ncbi:MAG TPA: leucine--tRNA ligase [Candidatus Peribacteria bacterium]|nr:leucine--tRNA ligase [Candidatus Peribacteria bacterium]
MPNYEPTKVESKWQKKWDDAKAFEADLSDAKDKFYSMVMFPYPSGDKLHVGHWYNFAPADSYARFQRMKGKSVFCPMGFDAFGLPAENYAIKTGIHPNESIAKNVQTMIAQLKRIGCMYDWDKMVNTSTPQYYRWTQWLFLEMLRHGLAYKKKGNVNYCPKDQTVLANEQVVEGKCERCGTEVVQKSLEQWYWKITDYAQKLLDGLDGLDWPEKTKIMQRNWIGRSEGVNIKSRIKDLGDEFEVYDSVPQTFMAQTFTVIAPEHPLLLKMIKGTPQEAEILAFVDKIKKKKAAKRFNFDEDVEGIFTGRYVDNPFGTGDLPIWVASFVVMDYGTGIVHCSAHDQRDFAFAKKYGIPLRPVMFPSDPQEAEKVKNLDICYSKEPEAVMQQPEKFKGRKWGEVRPDIINFMEKDMKIAKRSVHYRLRDWLVSRQRYWGAPIPVVYDPEGNPHPVPEEHLPWTLPTDVEFRPTGESPLKLSKEFVERTEKIFGKGWRPEYDTMDTFVCSSFYELMYLGGHQQEPLSQHPGVTELIDVKTEKSWMPVDMYIGGPEHACMHLIYARFVMMALKDFGYVEHSEPFKKLVHQGLITNQGAKMSKSKGNVVSPDTFVDYHGSDVFRLYLMFMGPFTDGGDWSDTGIRGTDRFVQRMWRTVSEKAKAGVTDDAQTLAAVHKSIKKVAEDIEKLHFNTAISTLMEMLNVIEAKESLSMESARAIALLLSPIAPHLSEELWELLGGKGFAMDQQWPAYDAKYLVQTTLKIVVQVNGKLRATLEVPADTPEAEILAKAKADPHVQKFLEGKAPKKEIYVKGKLVSLVI